MLKLLEEFAEVIAKRWNAVSFFVAITRTT